MKKLLKEFFSPTGWVEEPDEPIVLSLWDEEEEEEG